MPPKQKPKHLKSDGGRMSKKERAAIRREAARPPEYCWVDACYHFEPCPYHHTFNNPRDLASLLHKLEGELKAMRRERLIPCLLPLYQALQHEWNETEQLEVKGMPDRQFAGARDAALVDSRIALLLQQSEAPQVVPQFAPTVKISPQFQHIISVAERRLARQFESLNRLAGKFGNESHKNGCLIAKNDSLTNRYDSLSNALRKARDFEMRHQRIQNVHAMTKCVGIISEYLDDGTSVKIVMISEKFRQRENRIALQAIRSANIPFLFSSDAVRTMLHGYKEKLPFPLISI